MADQDNALNIRVDVGPQNRPRLHVTASGQSMVHDLDVPGSARLGASLVLASSLCSMNLKVPEGLTIDTGLLPVVAAKAYTDDATKLPVLDVEVLGGGKMTLAFDADTAARFAADLAALSQKVTGTVN